MKKILILGSGGMLGHMVNYFLKSLEKYKVIDASYPVKLHENSILLDVSNRSALEELIISEKPDIVVNCIGILIKGSINDPSNAIYLNSYFPHQLAKVLRKTGGRLIHVSTDCVFSGKKGKYTEEDFRDADDTYGRSKALGEVINDEDLTLRTSIVGPEIKKNGEGLFHWFMKQSGEINGFTNVLWGGVTTLELAKVVDAAIEQKLTGLIHITNNLPICKYDLLKLFQKVYNKIDVIIHSTEAKRVDKSLKTLRSDFRYVVPSYERMVEDQYEMMFANKEIYTQYFNFQK